MWLLVNWPLGGENVYDRTPTLYRAPSRVGEAARVSRVAAPSSASIFGTVYVALPRETEQGPEIYRGLIPRNTES